jgi:hypothetical protein
MRLGSNVSALLSLLVTFSSAGAAELGPATSPALQKLLNTQVTCSNQQAYMKPPQGQGKDESACQKCKDAVKQWGERMQNDAKTAVGNDGAITANGKANMTKAQGAMRAQQDSHQDTSGAVDKAGKQAQAQRATNASGLGKQFSSCAQEVEQACQGNIDDQDKQKGQEAKQACEEGAKASEAVAAEKSGSGMDMGQLGQMAQQLAQGLGSMMQKKQGESSTPTPTDSSSSGLSTPAEATMASSKPNGALQHAQSATFDGVNAAKVAEVGTNGTAFNNGAGGAGVLPAASQSYDSGGAGGSGSESSSYGSDPRGGGGFAGLGTSGGGAGGGGGNSSGASTFDPDAAAAKAAAGGQDANGAYEIGAGGGGGSRFLGLKSKSGDLSDLDGALGGESGGAGLDLASLGGGEEGRGPASEGEGQNADIHADGSSLFNVVRSKLVEIKKRGNI